MARFSLFILPVFFPAVAAGQESGAEIPALIRKLGSDRFAERESATHALDRIGIKAVPALEKALGGSLEMSRRARGLLSKIQERALQEAVRAPRRLAWDLEEKSPLRVLEKVHKEWGVSHYLKLNRETLAKAKVSLKTEALPFWEAWDRFVHKAGLAEPLLAPTLGPAQASPIPGNAFQFRLFPYELHPWKKWLLTDRDLRETPVLILGDAPEWAMDLSGPVRVRSLLVDAGESQALLLEMRPQPGLGWLSLESITLSALEDAVGKKASISTELQRAHDATVRKSRENWNQLIEHLARRDQVPWPCDSVLLELPQSANRSAGWKEIRGAMRARVFHSQAETCLEDVARQDGKIWENSNGLRGKVLENRITDDGTLCLRLRLEGFEKWVADYPGPSVRKIRPGVVVFVGAGDIAADLLQVRDVRGQPLPRVLAKANTTDDGAALELDLHYRIEPGGDETFRLVMLRQYASVVSFPFHLRNLAPVVK